MFAATIPPSWYNNSEADKNSEAEAAIESWMEQVAAFTAVDRYWLDVRQKAGSLDIHLVAMNRQQPIPLSGVRLTLRRDGIDRGGGALRPDSDGLLSGSLPVLGSVADGPLHLFIEETGAAHANDPEAPERAQRVPVKLVDMAENAEQSSDEDWTQGTNDSLLKAIMEVSSGRRLNLKPDREADFLGDSRWPSLFEHQIRQRTTHYWRVFVLLGTLALLGAVLLSPVDHL